MSDVSFTDIARARQRIRGLLPPTPLIYSHALSTELNKPIWFKCEQFQRTGSFKARGALNWVSTASPAELEHGLLTLSAGNHALGLAWAARERNVPLTVVMPEGSSPYKVRGAEALGAKVILHGDINAAMAQVNQLQKETGRTYVPPFDDERIITGQGTVGLEIMEQLPTTGRIICPVGGGGLISGVGTAAKAVSDTIEIIGLEPAGAATLKTAWDNGKPTRLDRVDTIAASLAASLAGEITWRISRRVVDRLETIDEPDIVAGIRAAFETCKLLAEPGAVLPIAALLKNRITLQGSAPTVLVISGGNIALDSIKSRF